MDAIKSMLASSCTVIRGGAEQRIDPKLLVPGDLVRLGLGDRVPADMRIIYTADLKTARATRGDGKNIRPVALCVTLRPAPRPLRLCLPVLPAPQGICCPRGAPRSRRATH